MKLTPFKKEKLSLNGQLAFIILRIIQLLDALPDESMKEVALKLAEEILKEGRTVKSVLKIKEGRNAGFPA